MWSAPPERLREALTDPGGGGGGARRGLRLTLRRGEREGPGLDVAVARVFRGAAAVVVRVRRRMAENVDGGGGGGGDGGGEGSRAPSAAAKRAPRRRGRFRERRRRRGRTAGGSAEHRGSHGDARADVIEGLVPFEDRARR